MNEMWTWKVTSIKRHIEGTLVKEGLQISCGKEEIQNIKKIYKNLEQFYIQITIQMSFFNSFLSKNKKQKVDTTYDIAIGPQLSHLNSK